MTTRLTKDTYSYPALLQRVYQCYLANGIVELIFPDDWPFTATTNGAGGAVDSITFTDPATGFAYKQTYTINGAGVQTAQSAWVKQ